MSRRMLALAAALSVGLVAPHALAQTRTPDEVVDLALGTLEEPLRLWRPGASIIVPGVPVWPPYKQEPPAAQRDFRLLDSPAAPPPTVGVPPAAPGTPGPSKPSSPPKTCPKPPKPCV